MNIKAIMELWQRGSWFIAKLPELDFVAQGRTVEEAKKNLHEVVAIQFEEMKEMGTFDEYLAECGFVRHGDIIEPENEMIGFERQVLRVA